MYCVRVNASAADGCLLCIVGCLGWVKIDLQFDDMSYVFIVELLCVEKVGCWVSSLHVVG